MPDALQSPGTCGEASWGPVRVPKAEEQAWVPKAALEQALVPTAAPMLAKLAKLAQLAAAA